MLTLIVREPDDGLKPVLPPYEAVIRLAPVANWLPYTVSEAVPEPERLTVPRVAVAVAKVTDPVGVDVPLADLTVAVNVLEVLTVKA
jgi:hypothetical protein